MDYKYDKSDKESIEEYARRLLNKSLNELNGNNEDSRFNNEKSIASFIFQSQQFCPGADMLIKDL